MNFNNDKPIYLQIVAYVCECILQEKWKSNEKILSVRDLGAKMEVNPNTVMRAYEKLQQDEIIFNKRGVGFFVVPDAIDRIKRLQKADFIANELTHTLLTAKLLGLSEEEVLTLYKQN